MKTQFLEVKDGIIAFDDEGEGPLIVAVPGMGDLRSSYRFLAQQLTSAVYRVVRMDVRGHGESSTNWPDYTVAAVGQDILDLVRSLNTGPAILVCNSMAAGAGVWAAAEAPELVKGLILLGPAVRGEVSSAFQTVLKLIFARPWGPTAWKAHFKSLFPTRKPADFAAYSAALKQNLQEPGRMESLQQMLIAPKTASESRILKVTTPTLVLMGTRDPDFKDPAAEANWVAEKLKGTVEMVLGAGHYPHVDTPEITGRCILEYLNILIPEPEYASIP